MTTKRIVYVIDKNHPLYGQKVEAEYGLIEDGTTPVFNDLKTGDAVDVKPYLTLNTIIDLEMALGEPIISIEKKRVKVSR